MPRVPLKNPEKRKGNHDDPAGGENLSALDLLATCNLVNYFGKHTLSGGGAGKIKLKPVLMQKGRTRLALYGLGYIRDARLHQMFSVKGNVEWARPEMRLAPESVRLVLELMLLVPESIQQELESIQQELESIQQELE